MKRQELRTISDTTLCVIESIRLIRQIEGRVSSKDFLVVQNVAGDLLKVRAIKDANVKSVAPRKEIIYFIKFSAVLVKGTAHEGSPVA